MRPFWFLLLITHLKAGPCGLDALWLLPIKHHTYVQAVDAKIWHCSSTELLLQ